MPRMSVYTALTVLHWEVKFWAVRDTEMAPREEETGTVVKLWRSWASDSTGGTVLQISAPPSGALTSYFLSGPSFIPRTGDINTLILKVYTKKYSFLLVPGTEPRASHKMRGQSHDRTTPQSRLIIQIKYWKSTKNSAWQNQSDKHLPNKQHLHNKVNARLEAASETQGPRKPSSDTSLTQLEDSGTFPGEGSY